jgi:hypothetical protein
MDSPSQTTSLPRITDHEIAILGSLDSLRRAVNNLFADLGYEENMMWIDLDLSPFYTSKFSGVKMESLVVNAVRVAQDVAAARAAKGVGRND